MDMHFDTELNEKIATINPKLLDTRFRSDSIFGAKTLREVMAMSLEDALKLNMFAVPYNVLCPKNPEEHCVTVPVLDAQFSQQQEHLRDFLAPAPWTVFAVSGWGLTYFFGPQGQVRRDGLTRREKYLTTMLIEWRGIVALRQEANEPLCNDLRRQALDQLLRLISKEASEEIPEADFYVKTGTTVAQEAPAETTSAGADAESGQPERDTTADAIAEINKCIAELNELTADLTLLSCVFTSFALSAATVGVDAGELADGDADSAVDDAGETGAGEKAAAPIAASTGNPLLDALF